MSNAQRKQNLRESAEILLEELQKADAILIGGGSGLSSAAGYNHYHWAPYFEEKLQRYQENYEFKSPFDGFYHVFSDYEAQWGYYAGYIQAMWDAPTGKVYKDLARIVKGKETFVLTSNIDMQFQRVFPEDKICSFQGDFGYLQCCQPCEDKIYSNKKIVKKMMENLDESLRIPEELVPRCRRCGRVMVPWVRDDTFLQGEDWKRQYSRFEQFVRKWGAEPDKRLLLLELGVGEMTPSVIRLPFWDMAHSLENVRYVRINLSEESVPLHIKDQAVKLQEDIAAVLEETVTLLHDSTEALTATEQKTENGEKV